MVYFEDNEVLIRDMIQSDAPIITIIDARSAVYIISPCGAVSHHAQACIFLVA